MAVVEKRQTERVETNRLIRLWLGQAEQMFPGRSLNVSPGGMLVQISMRAPIRVGQEVRVDFTGPETRQPQQGVGDFRPARVVRVDRTEALETAEVKAALAFSGGGLIVAELMTAKPAY